MQVADGCGSGTLYKAGLGFPLNMGILPLFALGSFLGSVHLQGWLALGQIEPVGFVQSWGVPVALLVTGGLLLGLAALMRSVGGRWQNMVQQALGVGRCVFSCFCDD